MRYTISARYGELDNVHHTPHTGIDFVMQKGTPIHSIHSGVVEKVTHYGNQNIGNGVLVKWDDGHTAIYGHLSEISVHKGQHIDKGDLLGMSGNSGNSTGAHLHFGLKNSNDHFTDPSPYISNIEHMNDKVQIAQHVQHTQSFADAIHSQLSIYSDLLHNIKVNFINLIHSVDYSVFIQHFQNFFDLFF